MNMTYMNENERILSRVRLLPSGWYAVTLMDLDSGEVLPYARHLKDIDEAMALAKLWANLDGPASWPETSVSI